MLNRKILLAAAIVAVFPLAAGAQTNSSNPTQAPVTGAAGADAKTEAPGANAKMPGAAKQPTPAQNSSNTTQAPVTGGGAPSAAAKSETPGPNAKAPGAAKQPNPAQNSSNMTQAPVSGAAPSAAAKTENSKK